MTSENDQDTTGSASSLFRDVVVLLAILGGAWAAFLGLEGGPPVDSTSSLVMVWVSAAILLIAVFPGIVRKIKRLKLWDIEVELQDTVKEAVPEFTISVPDSDNFRMFEKGGVGPLFRLLEDSYEMPQKPVLLIVNVGPRGDVIVPHLFIYLYFLDLIGASVTVLFVDLESQRRYQKNTVLTKKSVVGALGGALLKREIVRNYPEVLDLIIANRNDNQWSDSPITPRFFDVERVIGLADSMWRSLKRFEPFGRYRVSRRVIQNTFWENLSTRTIGFKVSDEDVETVLRALSERNDLILVFSGSRFKSIIETRVFSSDISKRILEERKRTREVS